MKRLLSCIIVVMMVVGTGIAAVMANDTLPFADVKEDDWHYEYVKTVYDANVMKGEPGGIFNPDKEMTRAELVTTLCNFSGVDPSGRGKDLTFADTPKNEWFADYVGWAVKEGLVKGDDETTFRPNDSISREELATVISRYVTYEELSIKGEVLIQEFDDKEEFKSWSAEHIEALRVMGLIAGKNAGKFEPESTATRAEVATIVARMLTLDNTGDEPEETEPDPTDPTPENIGILYENQSSGIQISRLIDIGDGDTEVQASGNGVHGGHESKVVRTKYGTYVVYVTADPDHTGENTNEFSFFKVTASGGELIYQDTFEHSQGSCVTNILQGEDGIIYIVLFNGWDAARLTVYTYDAKIGGIPTKDVQYVDFDYGSRWLHGYGYTQPVIDKENGKIYAIFNGGDVGGYINYGGMMEQGYIAWFIYDIATGTWDDECYTIAVDWRVCYDNAYPDGNGGMIMVVQRAVQIAELGKFLGVDFKKQTGYVWDALYVIHVPDVTKEEFTIKPIFEPEYSKEDTGVSQWSASHYACGGTTMDDEGNLHVVYSANLKRDTTIYYAVYDKDMNEVRNSPIKLTHKKNEYMISLAKGAGGDIYILAYNAYMGTDDANLEIWKIADDFMSIKKVCSEQTLRVRDESDDINTITPSNTAHMIVTSVRNNSDIDGITGVVIPESDGNGMYDYYYFAIKLP